MTLRRALRHVAAAAALLAAAWLALSWFEAEKEVRILCAMQAPGDSLASVVRMLETGNWLHYDVRGENGAKQTVEVATFYHATSRCTVELEAGRVVAASYRK